MSQKDMSISFPAGLFKDVCQIIEAARQRVAISVNSELTLMYWHIGERINKEILHDQRAEYGKAIVSTLSAQLMELYGKDFNSRNLHRMMQFAREFSDFQIVSTLSTQLPWSAFLEVLPVDDALARVLRNNGGYREVECPQTPRPDGRDAIRTHPHQPEAGRSHSG